MRCTELNELVVHRKEFVLMLSKSLFRWFITLSLVLVSFCVSEPLNAENGTQRVVQVGVILDMNSRVGDMAKDYISMALSDFYAKHANYQTRLALSVKDSRNDVVVAASAALELMNNNNVQAIIGPQRSTEAKFIINLGQKAKMPIISFSATSPSLSPDDNPFFIRTAQDDRSQVKAIASIVHKYGWREVVLIYEDTEYGNGLVPYLTDALEKIDTHVSYRSVISPSSDYQKKILKELGKIMARETRVLLVHMTASLGSELFRQAAEIGMMTEGFAWIITDGLSTLLDPIGSNVFDTMQGVLGVRPYLPLSKGLKYFKTKWKRSRLFTNKGTKNNLPYYNSEINLFGLWAYDTIWALARAVELVAQMNSSAFRLKNVRTEALGLRVSESGAMLLKMLERTKFKGISGEFHLRRRQLKPTTYEITNVIGKIERVVGYWTANKGIIPAIKVANSSSTSSENELKTIVWPGSKKVPPKGWVIPLVGEKLKIGVPVPNGFNEFFNVEWDPRTDEPTFSGFSYDMFLAALDKLPFAIPHKFVPYANSSRKIAGTYNELLYQIKLKNFDVVVGDTTINANRTSYVDFTLPYFNSGVSMVVKIKDNEKKNIWIFLKPLSWDLWLTTGGAFVFTGFVVWIFEHRTNTEFRGPPNQQLGTIFWFSFSTLVFAHREKVVNNWSRFVLIIWIFVVLILTQSHTASLASMLTVQRLQPAVVDVNELKRNGAFVGYQRNSFVREFIIERLGFNESKLMPCSDPDQYHEALSKGSKNGGVDAIFEETPYIRIFLAKYCSKYTMVGPIYKADGFGFAFPVGSPLVSYFSRAILNVTEDYNKMEELERKYFGDQTSCQDQSSKFSSDDRSLSVYSFGGLFIITGLASGFSCLIYLVKFHREHWPAVNAADTGSSLWSRVTKMAKHFDNKEPSMQCDFNNRVESNARGEVLSVHAKNLYSSDVENTSGIDEQDEHHSTDSGLLVHGGAQV